MSTPVNESINYVSRKEKTPKAYNNEDLTTAKQPSLPQRLNQIQKGTRFMSNFNKMATPPPLIANYKPLARL